MEFYYSLNYLLFLVLCYLDLSNGQPCPNNCNSAGRCVNPGQTCECFNGFTGPDCSLRTCPLGIAWADVATGTDTAHNLALCSNRGVCDQYSGLCICLAGFEGAACQRISCPGSCNNVGVCLSMRSYALTKDPGYGTVYTYQNNWDSEIFYGCKCDSSYDGPDCSLQVCSTGDDPLTGNGVSSPSNPTQVNTIQRVNCRGGTGTFTLTFRGFTTKPIPFDASANDITTYLEALPSIGIDGVAVILYGLQACLPSGQSYFQVEFLQDFGTLPLMTTNYQNLGIDSQMAVTIFQSGTKENEDCSGRGLCDITTGNCACATGFSTSDGYNNPGTRGDCGYYPPTPPIQSCPGIISCSGNGVCAGSPTFVCECSEEWTGADCSERKCPYGNSWFAYPTATNTAHLNNLVECSNMGVCDRSTGICTCMANFEGAACEKLSCPGALIPCNGNGQCLTMAMLAQTATINGDIASYTYGQLPNNPSTWDANMVQGCLCDDGYTGYDCSLFLCPFGDDPSTLGQVNEVQILSCTDQDLQGSVIISFRQQSSISISATATSSQVAQALSNVPSIGAVNVVPVDGVTDSLCTTSGNRFSVTFLQAHGHLPLMTYQVTRLDVFDITELVAGTTENLECSGRGICDRSIGICNCFIGYGSSDGQGNAGIIGDCGHILAVSS